MKNLTILIICVLFIFVFVNSGFAKTKKHIEVEVANWKGLGYKFPALNFSFSTENKINRFLLINRFSYSPTDKIKYGKVDQISTSIKALLKVSNFLVGGGINANKIWFYQYRVSYNTFVPFLNLGYENKDFRILGEYKFSGYNKRYYYNSLSFSISDDLS